IQFQSEFREAQFTLERARHEVAEASAQNALVLSNRLQSIEESLAAQRAFEAKTIDAMQGSSRFMLTSIGVLAGVGFVAIGLTAFFQWRTIGRLAEISASVTASRPVSSQLSMAALGLGESHLVTSGEASSAKLLDTIDRLEQRLSELEHATSPVL